MGNICSICSGQSSSVPQADSQRNADICKLSHQINLEQCRDCEKGPRVQLRSLSKKAREAGTSSTARWAFIMTRSTRQPSTQAMRLLFGTCRRIKEIFSSSGWTIEMTRYRSCRLQALVLWLLPSPASHAESQEFLPTNS